MGDCRTSIHGIPIFDGTYLSARGHANEWDIIGKVLSGANMTQFTTYSPLSIICLWGVPFMVWQVSLVSVSLHVILVSDHRFHLPTWGYSMATTLKQGMGDMHEEYFSHLRWQRWALRNMDCRSQIEEPRLSNVDGHLMTTSLVLPTVDEKSQFTKKWL